MKHFTKLASMAAAIGAGLPILAFSQPYPSRPIRVIVPAIIGVLPDLVARQIAPKLGEQLGQPVVVDTRPGASGVIGTEAVARAAPDGYTILFATTGQMIALSFLKKDLPFDPVKDFIAIGPAVEPVEVMVIGPSVPANSLRELIEHARRNPGKLGYGSAGTGSYFHVLGEAINFAAGTKITHVPYKGTVQSFQDAMTGRLDVTFGTVVSTRALVAAGKLKLVAVCSTKRYAGLPDVPTLIEGIPGLDRPPSWFSYWGPTGLPQAIVSRLNADIQKVIALPEVRAWFEASAVTVIASTPEQVAAEQKRGTDTYRKVINAIGIKPE